MLKERRKGKLEKEINKQTNKREEGRSMERKMKGNKESKRKVEWCCPFHRHNSSCLGVLPAADAMN
jgi:hypothetical protein